MPTVLMVGDCDGVTQATAGLLQRRGYDVLIASSGREGIALARARAGDAVVTSLQCADVSAETLVQQLHGATAGQLPVIVTSTAHTPASDTAQPATIRYVDPSALDRQLVTAVEEALRSRREEASVVASTAEPRLAAPRVLIAADRQGRYETIAAKLIASGMEVVARERADQGSPEAWQEYAPNIVLIERAPTFEATLARVREWAARSPQLRLVFLDAVHTRTAVVALLDAGVVALLPKRATLDDIVHCVWMVAGGAMVIPRSNYRSLLSVAAVRRPASSERRDLQRVSQREHDIIALIADGLSNKEIATALNIATFTVKSHVHNILQKLGLETRTEVAREFLFGRIGVGSHPMAEPRQAHGTSRSQNAVSGPRPLARDLSRIRLRIAHWRRRFADH